MRETMRSKYPCIGTGLAICFGFIGMWSAYPPSAVSAESEQQTRHGEGAQLRDDADKLLQGNRSVLGRVLAITSDQIKIDIGEVQPRFLPLKQAQQKGFPAIAEGDDVIIVLNAENLLVDYHPLDGEASAHTIIRGEIAQNLPVGQEHVVIKSAGKELSFTIRSQARSKVAAIPVGVAAVFLIDETNQITDVGLSGRQTAKQADRQHDSMPPIKGAHKQIEGTVTSPLRANHITVRTTNGSDKPFEVRELLHDKIAGLRKGDAVILLVDTDNKVIDMAVPPSGR